MTDQRPIHVDDEERIAAEMASELEALAAESSVAPAAGFGDRVMAAVAREPLPQPARAFGAALAARRLGAALASIGDAWRVVVGGSTPIFVRAQALALVLVVTIGSLAVAGGATVGAIDLLNANQPPHPSPTTPLPSDLQASPSPSPSPNPTGEPSTESAPTPDASETPEGTDTPGATQTPELTTPRATGTDDHGGGSGGGGETPHPTAAGTNDHGGGDG